MIDIVRFDHISMAVPERDRQVELLERLFGFRWMRDFEDDEGYCGATLAVPGRSRIYWEVLAPDGPESYLHRFLDGPHGPGLHHVSLYVPSVRATAETLLAQGIEPWALREAGRSSDRAAWDSAGPNAAADPYANDWESSTVYIHPRGGQGFLYQFLSGDRPGAPEPFEDHDEHTLGITAVNHLAHAHHDRDMLAAWYERVFGFETIYRSRGDGLDQGFQTLVLETPTRQLRIETIAPAGEHSFIVRFLAQRGGPAIHHVTFEVGDWDRAVEACEYHEVPLFGERTGVTDGVPWQEAFIHPRDTGGMLVQFFWQAEQGVWI